MVRLNMEIIWDDTQSMYIELLDENGENINPAEIANLVMWVKPAFMDKFYPTVEIAAADEENGIGNHLKITFTRAMLKQTWTQAQYGIEIVRDDSPTTLIGGKVLRIY